LLVFTTPSSTARAGFLDAPPDFTVPSSSARPGLSEAPADFT